MKVGDWPRRAGEESGGDTASVATEEVCGEGGECGRDGLKRRQGLCGDPTPGICGPSRPRPPLLPLRHPSAKMNSLPSSRGD